MRIDAATVKRFWDRVPSRPEAGCWEWSGTTSGPGYGMLHTPEGARGAHRISPVINIGPIPAGFVVMHKCDNPSCVNPDHLKAGTQRENILDKWAKGRAVLPTNKARGSKQGLSKLHEHDIPVIRDRISKGEPDCRIAKDYGVDHGAIRNIRKGISWKHVT